MHYCIFKNTDSRELGLFMEKTPPRSKPKPRYESYVVPGRSGTLTVSDGSYDVVQRTADFAVFDRRVITEISRVFDGAGWLTFDDMPDRKCYARVCNQLDFAQITAYVNSFSVLFECQPYFYEVFPAPIEAPRVLINQGNCAARPAIELVGTGDVKISINGKAFEILGIPGKAWVDCEKMAAWSRAGLIATKGDFLELPIGKSEISWEGNVSKLTITPNWRWI